MKTIDKIIIFKKDGKPTDGIVLFADSSFKELEYKKLVKDIIKFSNQDNCTIDELYQDKKIVFESMLDFKAHTLVPSTKRGHKGEMEEVVE